MISAAAITPEDLPAVWPQVSHLIKDALEHDPKQTPISDIATGLESGQYLLILMLDDLKLLAALTVELVTTNKGKTCNIITAGGEQADQWENPFLDALEVLAKEQGATKLTLIGRPGWSKRLRGRGFKVTHTRLEAQI